MTVRRTIQMGSTPFPSLVNEEIGKYLELRDLYTLRLLDREWHAIASRTIYLRILIKGGTLKEDYLPCFKRYGKRVRALGVSGDADSREFFAHAAADLEMVSNVHSLYLFKVGTIPPSTKRVCAEMKGLRSIHIYGECRLHFSEFASFARLTSIFLYGTGSFLSDLGSLCFPCLHSIHSDTGGERSYLPEDISVNFPALVTLLRCTDR